MTKVLVVDDHAANRALVVTLVNHRGYQALEAADGAEALELVRTQHPELVISDILMPTMDGFEFVRQLRADPLLAATEVIFYSAHYREREARNLARACGVSRVLVKPCEPQDILLAIDQSLAHVPVPVPTPHPQDFEREHLRLMTDKLSEKLGDLEATNRRLAALTDLNLHLASERDPGVLLQKFCHGARDLFGAKYAVLGVSGALDTATLVCASGIEAATWDSLEPPGIDQGLLGRVRAERLPQRLRSTLGGAGAVGLPAGYPPLHAALVAPVVSLSTAYGWICLADKLGADEFSQEDSDMLCILSAQVGRIYENGNLYADVQRHAAQLQAEIAERQRAAEELRISQAGLHRAQRLSKLTHVVTGPDGRFESWSESLPRMVDIDPADMYKSTSGWLARVHPDDRDVFRDKAVEASTNGVRTDFEYRLHHHDGTWLHVRQVMEPLDDSTASGKRGRWFNTIQDITEQKAAENKILRMNRVYAVLSGINTLIVRVRNRDELFQESCRIAVEHGKFKRAWIGVADRAAMKIVPAASEGAKPEFLAYVAETFSLREDAAMGNTLSARALRERKAIVANDIRRDSHILLSPALLEDGIRSMAVLPLLVSGEAVAVLDLYSDEPDFFDQEEMKLLTELAGDIGFALDHIEKAERLDYLAYYDEITGLPNRALLADRCTQDISDGRREGHGLALLVLGIDRFKAVNDALGHAAGDQVLKQLAARIKSVVREQDTIARAGGDEFVLVMPDGTPEAASLMATRLQQLVAQPYPTDQAEINITASIGIAAFPGDGEDFAALFKSAQVAMHLAEEHGDGNYRFFSAEMAESISAQATLVAALRTAVVRGQLVLHYQPFADLQTGRIAGMEALLRWTHPELGSVSPARFIPVAEQSGLIVEIGAWVLRQACQDLRHWLDQGIEAPPVSVNISPIQFRDPLLMQQVEHTLAEFQLEPGMICIEVTEGALMKDVAHSETLLRAFKTLGVKLSLDDFGTGYSSLSYLKLFPFDKVKIDQSFVRGLGKHAPDAVITKVVISMAHGLGLRVIAEGVETEPQCEFLRANMSDEIQGYFFSRPVPKDQMELLLRENRCLPTHLLRERTRARTMLLVDDEPNVLASLRRLLRGDGYQILLAGSGTEGLEQLARNPVDIIMSDQRMPGMSGVEFLTQAKALYPDTIRIVLSGYTELQAVTDAINEGAVYRFLTKPWDDAQLRNFVREAFEHKELADENRQLALKIRTANQELASSNRQLQEVLDRRTRKFELREKSLNMVREVLQCIPVPVIGLDDEGLMVFLNAHAQKLFTGSTSMLGQELSFAMPTIDSVLNMTPAGEDGLADIDGLPYRVQWQRMGNSSTSSGRIVTLARLEAP